METTHLGNLRRNDIFSFTGQKTQWRVSLVITKMIDRTEVPIKIICYSIGNNKKRTFDLTIIFDYKGSFCEMFNRSVNLISPRENTGNNYPVKIEDGEWYFKGCFITEQNHPKLKKYHIHQDTEENLTVGTCNHFHQAHKMCEENEVINPLHGAESFIKIKQ